MPHLCQTFLPGYRPALCYLAALITAPCVRLSGTLQPHALTCVPLNVQTTRHIIPTHRPLPAAQYPQSHAAFCSFLFIALARQYCVCAASRARRASFTRSSCDANVSTLHVPWMLGLRLRCRLLTTWYSCPRPWLLRSQPMCSMISAGARFLTHTGLVRPLPVAEWMDALMSARGVRRKRGRKCASTGAYCTDTIEADIQIYV